jgi:hypothetical protein
MNKLTPFCQVVIPELPDPTNFVLRPRSFDFAVYSPDDSDSAVERLVTTSASCSVYSDDDSDGDTSFPFFNAVSNKSMAALSSNSSPSSTASLSRKSPSPSLSTDDASSPNLPYAGWNDGGAHTSDSR